MLRCVWRRDRGGRQMMVPGWALIGRLRGFFFFVVSGVAAGGGCMMVSEIFTVQLSDCTDRVESIFLVL